MADCPQRYGSGFLPLYAIRSRIWQGHARFRVSFRYVGSPDAWTVCVIWRRRSRRRQVLSPSPYSDTGRRSSPLTEWRWCPTLYTVCRRLHSDGSAPRHSRHVFCGRESCSSGRSLRAVSGCGACSPPYLVDVTNYAQAAVAADSQAMPSGECMSACCAWFGSVMGFSYGFSPEACRVPYSMQRPHDRRRVELAPHTPAELSLLFGPALKHAAQVPSLR